VTIDNITAPVAEFNSAAITTLRTTLWAAGYRPVVLYSNDKRPWGNDWANRARWTTPEAVTVAPHPELANTGILGDGLRAVDIDVDDPGRAEDLKRLARTMLGAAPIRYRENSTRTTWLYRAAEGEPCKRSVSNKATDEKVEVLGRGQQFMTDGIHPSGMPVRWLGICPRDSLAPVTEEAVGAFLEAAAKVIGALDVEGGDGWSGDYFPPPEMLDCADKWLLERIYAAMPNNGFFDSRTKWISLAHATAAAFRCDPFRGCTLFLAHAERWPGPIREGEADKVYGSIGDKHQVGAEHIVRWAIDLGVDSRLIADYTDDRLRRMHESAFGMFDYEDRPADAPEPDARAYPGGMAPDHDYGDAGPGSAPVGSEHSDATVAQFFIREHGDTLRYVKAWDSWLFWNGRRWEKDSTAKVRNLCRLFLQDYTAKYGGGPTPWTKGEINGMMSARKVYSVLDMASADRRIASTVDQWDSDDWLLGTPGGYVDLRTGVLHGADPRKLMSKSTAATPGGDCPKWRKFISEITGSNKELQGYIQRFLGYCLTGLNTEHVFHFGHGKGGNGKNVLLDTFTAVMGDYAISVPAEIFVVSQHDRHPTEVAMMAGARVVIGQEVPTGRKWNITRIKEWSGANANTKIRARFMNKDFFEFTPKAKLFLTGNDKPEIEKVDNAIRRRLRLLPLTVTIEEKDMILDLAEQLEAEFSGILAWQIEGLKEWQRIGLSPPKAVIDASTEYLDSADRIQNWIDDRCEIGAGHSAGSTELYADFNSWSGYLKDGVSRDKFVRELIDRGYPRGRSRVVRSIEGLRLLPPPPPPPPPPPADKTAGGNPETVRSVDLSSEKPLNDFFH
jgi:putative DNA primase/helicase